jgi:hypothetical protein
MVRYPRLAATRPWVIEALNFLAGSVHQERGSGGSSSRSLPPIFSASMFEDEDDEDMDDDEAGAAVGSVITREQLSAALNSLSALGTK